MNRISACFGFAMLLAWSMSEISADAIVVTKAMSASTIAEIFVEDDVVRVELEIGSQGVAAFRDLLPDKLYQRFEIGDALDSSQRRERFLKQGLMVTADGQRLEHRILSVTARKRLMATGRLPRWTCRTKSILAALRFGKGVAEDGIPLAPILKT